MNLFGKVYNGNVIATQMERYEPPKFIQRISEKRIFEEVIPSADNNFLGSYEIRRNISLTEKTISPKGLKFLRSVPLGTRIISEQLKLENMSEEEVKNLRQFRFEIIQEIIEKGRKVARESKANYFTLKMETKEVDNYRVFPSLKNLESCRCFMIEPATGLYVSSED